jgi:hypothetical protein
MGFDVDSIFIYLLMGFDVDSISYLYWVIILYDFFQKSKEFHSVLCGFVGWFQ